MTTLRIQRRANTRIVVVDMDNGEHKAPQPNTREKTMQSLPFVERKIIELLLNTAQEKGAVFFQVSDEEEVECHRTNNVERVKESIGLTDSTIIDMYDENKNWLSFVYLVHGNDEDVITDCSANEWMDGVMDVIEKEIR